MRAYRHEPISADRTMARLRYATLRQIIATIGSPRCYVFRKDWTAGATMEAVGRIETVDGHPAERSRPSIAVEKLGDLPPLTGLRFFAAFFILLGHATPMMLKFTPSPQLVINVTNSFLEVGMELFFVLSGFVIHYNYAAVGRLPNSQNLARFYIARFARIYPLYVLFLALQH